jgi:hypothetical protein
MPYEKYVDETHTYWCPKWYWPFAVCSRTRHVHKWCYNFRWVRETGFGFVLMHEGCEGETLYRWYTGAFFVFGETDYNYESEGIESFEQCYDSPRQSAGTCAA